VGCAAYWPIQVSKLESEAEQLHADFMQSQQNVTALERRLAGMESELVEQQQRVRATTVAVTITSQPYCNCAACCLHNTLDL
jgi:peptidoglycan hydrolase CwlO-like protein